jgi:hypothetical protein
MRREIAGNRDGRRRDGALEARAQRSDMARAVIPRHVPRTACRTCPAARTTGGHRPIVIAGGIEEPDPDCVRTVHRGADFPEPRELNPLIGPRGSACCGSLGGCGLKAVDHEVYVKHEENGPQHTIDIRLSRPGVDGRRAASIGRGEHSTNRLTEVEPWRVYEQMGCWTIWMRSASR